MSSHDISSSEAESLSERRVWGPWATTGFGFVVIVASLVVQMVVAAVLILVKGFLHLDISSGQLNFDEVLSVVMGVINANFGLIVTLSLFVQAIVCVGSIIIIVKLRRDANIKEYLGLRPITGKTILVLLTLAWALTI